MTTKTSAVEEEAVARVVEGERARMAFVVRGRPGGHIDDTDAGQVLELDAWPHRLLEAGLLSPLASGAETASCAECGATFIAGSLEPHRQRQHLPPAPIRAEAGIPVLTITRSAARARVGHSCPVGYIVEERMNGVVTKCLRVVEDVDFDRMDREEAIVGRGFAGARVLER